MHAEDLAHWCAAMGVARLNRCKVRWVDRRAQFGDPREPDLTQEIAFGRSRSPLLVSRGRRDLIKGAKRALEFLRDMPKQARSQEWTWLVSGSSSPIRFQIRRTTAGIDSFSLGTLNPASSSGGDYPVSAWIPFLAAYGAQALDGARQKWPKRESMHPDTHNNFFALMPSQWVALDEIVAWYRTAEETECFELRPISAGLSSYTSTR